MLALGFLGRDVAVVLALIDDHDAGGLAQDVAGLVLVQIGRSNSMFTASEWPTNTGTRTQVTVSLMAGSRILWVSFHILASSSV